MSFKKKKFMSKVLAAVSAAVMTVGAVPLEAAADIEVLPNDGIVTDPMVMPSMPTSEGQVDTGVMNLGFSWAYRKTPITITTMKNPKQDCVDYTVKVKTKKGAEREPWKYNTTQQWRSDYPDQPFPFWFDVDGTGVGKLTTWIPVLGTADGESILDTAQKLLRHKVNGEGEEVTFDDLMNKISSIFAKVPQPQYIKDWGHGDALTTIDETEQQKLIDAIQPAGERFNEKAAHGTPVNQLSLNEDEKETILDIVTDIMGIGYMQPTSGVREGDTVTFVLDEVLLKDDDDNYALVNMQDMETVEFVVDPKNNKKWIKNSECPEGGDHIWKYQPNGETKHLKICEKCNETIEEDHSQWYVNSYIKPTCTEDADAVNATCHFCQFTTYLSAEQVKSLGEGYVATGHNFPEEDWKPQGVVHSKTGSGIGHYHKCQNKGCAALERVPHVWAGEETAGTKCGVDFWVFDECTVCGTRYEYSPEECDLERAPELDVAPTCEDFGFTKYKCKRCGSIASDAIQPLGHDMEKIEEVPATCLAAGYIKYKCKNKGCDKEVTEELKMLSENGQHNFQRVVTVQPTCTREGQWEGEACTNPGCKATRNEKQWGYIPELGHNYVPEKTLMRERMKVENRYDKREKVWCVTRTCSRCHKSVKAEAYTVTYSQVLNKYNVTKGMTKDWQSLENGIHLGGQFDKNESFLFYKKIEDGTNKVIEIDTKDYNKKKGSIIFTFTDEFMSKLEDGEYRLVVMNGDEFSEIGLIVKDHKFTEYAETFFDDCEELSKEEYEAFMDEVVEIKGRFVFNAQPYLDEEDEDIKWYRNSGEDLKVSVMNGDYELSSVKCGDEVLTPDEDYTFSDGELTFKADFLADLEDGDCEFTVVYSGMGIDGVTPPDDLVFIVKIASAIPGDVNGDGVINLKDLVLLQRFLNKWDVKIDLFGADCDGSGKINLKDFVLLRRYLNKWDVILGKAA